MTPKALRGRWESPDLRWLAGDVRARLHAGRHLSGLPLGHHEGRVDLRGLTLPPVVESGHRQVGRFTVADASGVTEWNRHKLEGVDLSYARLDGLVMQDSTFRDVRLDHASLKGMRVWGMTMDGVSLQHADLRNALLTGRSDG